MDLLHQEERKTGELDTRAERLPNPAFPVERTLPRPPGNGLTRSLDGKRLLPAPLRMHHRES